jgi:GT2 family glycosyltransferase
MVTIAVVVPSLDGEVTRLLESIQRQTYQPSQVEVVVGVRPNGRARNQGVAKTHSEYLVFVDDDAILGSDDVIQKLIDPLIADPSIAITGASRLIPPDSSPFQQWVAREVPRIEHQIVNEPLETNPDPPYFYCEITTTCCAMRRDLFDQIGGFDDALIRGVDTEFFVRIRRLGYRLLLVPHAWTWHPAPANLRNLLRKHFYYGIGHAQEIKRDPSRGRGLMKWPWLYFLFRTAVLLPNIFIPFSYAAPQERFGFKPLKALTSYASAIGYTIGSYRTNFA